MFKSFKNLFFILLLIPLLTLSIVSCDSSDDDSSSDDGSSSSGDETPNYLIKVKIDGVETTFDGGFTEKDNQALASYDAAGNQTSIFAFSPSVSFTAMASGNGLMITDITGKAAGTFVCNVIYYNGGTTSAAANCSITIDSYGAKGEAVS